MVQGYSKYLPIGSVVLLKEGKKRLMITSCYIVTDDNKQYDYNGCLYPEGLISRDEVYFFNHDQIERIYAIGFSDEEEKEYKEAILKEISQNQNNV